jgi:epoxyqueuosine reductase QueG
MSESTVDEIGNRRAPDGHVYVCGACGKVSHWRYGFDEAEKNDATPGWDESCAMNCGLVDVSTIADPDGWQYPQRVRRLRPVTP